MEEERTGNSGTKDRNSGIELQKKGTLGQLKGIIIGEMRMRDRRQVM
jgi:hypothetical protein